MSLRTDLPDTEDEGNLFSLPCTKKKGRLKQDAKRDCLRTADQNGQILLCHKSCPIAMRVYLGRRRGKSSCLENDLREETRSRCGH